MLTLINKIVQYKILHHPPTYGVIRSEPSIDIDILVWKSDSPSTCKINMTRHFITFLANGCMWFVKKYPMGAVGKYNSIYQVFKA